MISTPDTAAANGRPREEAHLRRLWNLILRNRWLTIGVPLLVLALTALFLYFATPIYQTYTSLRIDEQQSSIAVLDALESIASGSQIETEMEVLRSRTLAATVVDTLGLRLRLVEPAAPGRSDVFRRVRVTREAEPATYHLEVGQRGTIRVRTGEGAPVGTFAAGDPIRLPGITLALRPRAARYEGMTVVVQPFDDAVERFRDVFRVTRPNREANLVVLRYQGPSPVLVRAAANTAARSFIARRQRVQSTQARGTVAFLEKQLDTLSAQLREAERTLLRFRQAENIVSPEAGVEAAVGRLADLLAKRDLLEAERDALARMLEEITSGAAADTVMHSEYRRLVAFPTLLENRATAQLLGTLAELDNKRAQLLKRRTPEDPDVLALTRRIQDLERQLATIARTYLEGLTNQVEALNERLARFRDRLAEVPRQQIRYARLERRAGVLAEVYTLLKTRLEEARIAAAVEASNIHVVDPAILPDEPIKPNVPLVLMLGLMLGAVLGVGGAFLREHMDTTVHTREELELATSGVPVLGSIPRIDDVDTEREPADIPAARFAGALVAGNDPRNPVSEAYRSLRTNITFSRPERAPKTLVFTSPTPGDGKSTTTANFALTLAQQGGRYLLVDADLRRGALNEALDMTREPGLSNLLLDKATLEEAVRPIQLEGGASLSFLPTGTLPPNPAELLGSERMRTLLERLEQRYDAVLIDAPPLNVVTDAAVLGTHADGVILVARAGRTDRGALGYAAEQLDAVRAPVLGTVLNDIDVRKNRYSGGYGAATYYYAADGGS